MRYDADVIITGGGLNGPALALALARAGLLDGRRATIHWENHDGFAEEFSEVELTRSVFVIDGNRMSTAGGTASIDMMLKIIAADHGEEVANTVADQLIYSSIRTDQDTQRLSIPTRIGVRHPKLSQVIQMMEANIEDPISPADLAEEVGMSTLVPALVLSELKQAFIIGFIIFIPFLVIDIVVSGALMALGMMMMPPVMVSLPFKLLLFVLVDGWALIITALVSSYG